MLQPQLLALNVMGVFRGEHPKMPIKSFFRSLVIVPQNAGFCITNETIFITTATPLQIRVSCQRSFISRERLTLEHLRNLISVPWTAGCWWCSSPRRCSKYLFVFQSSFRTSLAPVAPVPAVPSPLVAPVAVAPVPVMGLPDELEAKRKMVETLALQTGMNLQWSEK